MALKATLSMVNGFHRSVKAFHAGMNRIQEECKKVAGTRLICIDRNTVYDGKLFELVQKEEKQRGKQFIIECHRSIETEINTMHEQFRHGSEDVQKEWVSQMKRVDKMFLASFQKCILNALFSFSQIVGMQKHRAETQPIFTTQAQLRNGKIECRPSLISITNSINTIAKEIVCVAKVVQKFSKKWGDSSKNFFEIISSDELVLNRIVHIMNGAATCTRDVHDRMLEWDRKYRSLWMMEKQSYLTRYSKSPRQAYDEDIKKFIKQQLSVEA